MAKLITLLLEPKHSVYDYLTKKRSLLVSRGHGKTTFREEYTEDQTNITLLTPISGLKIDVVGVLLSTDATTGEMRLDFATSGDIIMPLYATAFAKTLNDDMHAEGAVDEAVRLNTTTGAKKAFVMINYRVVD